MLVVKDLKTAAGNSTWVVPPWSQSCLLADAALRLLLLWWGRGSAQEGGEGVS